MEAQSILTKVSIGEIVRILLVTGEIVEGEIVGILKDQLMIQSADCSHNVPIEQIEELAELIQGSIYDDEVNNYLNEICQTMECSVESAAIHPQSFINEAHVYEDGELTGDEWKQILNQYTHFYRSPHSSATVEAGKKLAKRILDMRPQAANKNKLYRLLGDIYARMGNNELALRAFRDAVLSSHDFKDWLNIAHISRALNNEYLMLYSLQESLKQVHLSRDRNLWYTYLQLIMKHGIFMLLLELIELREPDDEETQMIVNAWLYFLVKLGYNELAAGFYLESRIGASVKNLVRSYYSRSDLIAKFNNESYQRFENIVGQSLLQGRETDSYNNASRRAGYIYEYIEVRGYGFIVGEDWNNYFFYRNEINSAEILNLNKDIQDNGKVEVLFNAHAGPRNLVATKISLQKLAAMSKDELVKRARNLAESGQYSEACDIIRPLLKDEGNDEVKVLYEKWKDAGAKGVPGGNSAYAKAKRAQLIDKDLNQACYYFYEAIRNKERVESSVKDLVQVLELMGKDSEIIEVLKANESSVADKKWLHLTGSDAYMNLDRNLEAIQILEDGWAKNKDGAYRIHYLYGLGKAYSHNKDWIKAVGSFKSCLNIKQNWPAAQVRLAACYLELGLFSLAEEILMSCLENDADGRARELLQLLNERKNDTAGQYEKAINDWQHLIEQADSREEKAAVLDTMAKSTYGWKMYREALAYNQKLIAVQPDRIDARLNQARCHIGLGETEQASRIVREIDLARLPDKYSHEARMMINELEALRKVTTAAKDEFIKKLVMVVKEENPEDIVKFLSGQPFVEPPYKILPPPKELYTSYEQEKALDPGEALLYAARAVRHSAGFHVTWGLLARAFMDMQFDEAAYKCYLHSAHLARKNKNWWALGSFCTDRNMWLEAASAYAQLLLIEPGSSSALKRLQDIMEEKLIDPQGNEGLTQGLPDSLLSRLEEKIPDIAAHTKNYQSLRSLGNIFELHGLYNQAFKVFLQELAIYPSEIRQIKLAVWAMEHNYYQDALELFNEFLKEDPENIIAACGCEVAAILVNGGQVDPIVLSLFRWYPNTPSAGELIGIHDQYNYKGLYKQGCSIFDWVTRMYPDDKVAAISYALLLEKTGALEEAFLYFLRGINLHSGFPKKLVYKTLFFCFQYNHPDWVAQVLLICENDNKQSDDPGKLRDILDCLIALHKKIEPQERGKFSAFCDEFRVPLEKTHLDWHYRRLERRVMLKYPEACQLIKILKPYLTEETVLFLMSLKSVLLHKWNTGYLRSLSNFILEPMVRSLDELAEAVSRADDPRLRVIHSEVDELLSRKRVKDTGQWNRIFSLCIEMSQELHQPMLKSMQIALGPEWTVTHIKEALKSNSLQEESTYWQKFCYEISLTPQTCADLARSEYLSGNWVQAYYYYRELSKLTGGGWQDLDRYLCFTLLIAQSQLDGQETGGTDEDDPDLDNYPVSLIVTVLQQIIENAETHIYAAGIDNLFKENGGHGLSIALNALLALEKGNYEASYYLLWDLKSPHPDLYLEIFIVLISRLQEKEPGHPILNQLEQDLAENPDFDKIIKERLLYQPENNFMQNDFDEKDDINQTLDTGSMAEVKPGHDLPEPEAGDEPATILNEYFDGDEPQLDSSTGFRSPKKQGEHYNSGNSTANEDNADSFDNLIAELPVISPAITEDFSNFNEVIKETAFDIGSLQYNLTSRQKSEIDLQKIQMALRVKDRRMLLEAILSYTRNITSYMRENGEFEKQRQYAYEGLRVLQRLRTPSMDHRKANALLRNFLGSSIRIKSLHDIAEIGDQYHWVFKMYRSGLPRQLHWVFDTMDSLVALIEKLVSAEKISDKTQYQGLILSKTVELERYVRQKVSNLEFKKTLEFLTKQWQTVAIKEGRLLIDEPNIVLRVQNDELKCSDKLFVELYNQGNGIAEKVTLRYTGTGFSSSLSNDLYTVAGMRGQDKVFCQFDFAVDKEGEYEVEFELQYSDLSGKQMTSSFSAVVKVVEHKEAFLRLKNRYSIGIPTPESFFGRTKIIQTIRENLEETGVDHVLILHGARRVGKTSILNHIHQTGGPDIITVFVSLQTHSNAMDRNIIYVDFVRPIYYELQARSINIDLPPEELFDKEPTIMFDDFLNQVKNVTGGRILALLIDEFELLLDYKRNTYEGYHLLNYLRSIMLHRPEMRFLVAGAEKVVEMLRDYASTIFNIASMIEVSFMEPDELRELIVKPALPEVEYHASSIEKIQYLTNGHPYYTKIICRGIIDWLNGQQRYTVYPVDVETVAEKIVRDTQSNYFDHLWNMMDPMEKLIMSAVSSLTNHPQDALKTAEILQVLQKNTKYTISQEVFAAALTRLIDRHLLTETDELKTSNAYRNTVDLFRRWFKFNKPLDKTLMEVGMSDTI